MNVPAPWNRLAVFALAALMLVALAPRHTMAQEAEEAAPEGPPAEMASPRAVVRSFLSLMESDKKTEAAKLLDLSNLSSTAAGAKSHELAYELYEVLRVIYSRDPELSWPLPEDYLFENVSENGEELSPWDFTGSFPYPTETPYRIELTRDAQQRWQFSADTVSHIESLYVAAEQVAQGKPTRVERIANTGPSQPFSVWLGSQFPEELQEKHFLLPTYQWICLLIIAAVGWLLEVVSRWFLTRVGDALLKRYDPEYDGTTDKIMWQISRLILVGVWYIGALWIGLPYGAVNFLLVVLTILTILAALMVAFTMIDFTASYFSRRAKRKGRKFDDLLIPILATTMRILAITVAVLAAIAAFNEELPSLLLGGLGIGGVAIALASQETLSNLMGSITVLLDRPFEVGDWIVTEGVEGEVEAVGFRSTRIRTGPNSQVILPNSKLSSAIVDNLGRRKYRRLLTTIGVEYGTSPELIEAFCEGVRELIRRHPHTRKDYYCVYFNNFGPSSLDILLVTYFVVPDWATELRERHRLLADIVRLAGELGVEFAFPTQTLHLHRGMAPEPPDQPGEPDKTGQQMAAKIAGELPNYQDRPGKVTFPGPSQID